MTRRATSPPPSPAADAGPVAPAASGRSNVGRSMPSTDAPRIALVPERAPAWMADAVTAGGGHLVAPGRPRGWCGASPVDADGLAAALRGRPGRALGAAAVGRGRAVRPPHGRRPPVDVRQGRLRRAGGRDGADAGAGRDARPRHATPGPRRGRQPQGTQPARRAGSRSSAAAASPSRCCACCSRSTATSPSCATGRQDMDGADVVLESDRYATRCPAPTSSSWRWR